MGLCNMSQQIKHAKQMNFVVLTMAVSLMIGFVMEKLIAVMFLTRSIVVLS